MEILKSVLLIIFAAIFPLFTSAQKQNIVTVSDSQTYQFSKNQSPDEAMRIAFNRIQEKLIAEAFGESINSVTKTEVKNENGVSSASVNKRGTSQLGGEWIETIDGPKYKFLGFSDDYSTYWFEVTVKGKVRQYQYAKTEFKFKLLKNSTDVSASSYRFCGKDHFYMLFSAPRSGYISVYLKDEEGNVYFLSPYEHMEHDYLEVEGHKNLLLYSKHDGDPYREVREWNFTCNGSIEEHDTIYIIFSPNVYDGPNYEVVGDGDYHVTSEQEFELWLANARKNDPQMQVEHADIVVTPVEAN